MLEARSRPIRKAGLCLRAHAFGLPVKAVITTSDSGPLRRRSPGRGRRDSRLRSTEPPNSRAAIFGTPYQCPDDLARHPRAPRFHWVSEPLDLGTGSNRLRIVPYRTATAERQMSSTCRKTHLLYTSDLFAPDNVPMTARFAAGLRRSTSTKRFRSSTANGSTL